MTGIPHGTPEGYHAGCKTRVGCPAAISCREVYTRYRGDLTFRRAYDAGQTLAEIAVADVLAANADVLAEREARRVARQKTHAPRGERRTQAPRERMTWTLQNDIDLRACIDDGLSVSAAARRMRKGTSTLRDHAADLGLSFVDGRATRVPSKRNRGPGGATGQRRVQWSAAEDQAIIDGAEAGMHASAIADQLGRGRGLISRHAALLGVTLPPEPRKARAQSGEPRPKVKRKDSRPTYARRGREPRTVQPHGTNASYARGCRVEAECPNYGTDTPTCSAAQRAYHQAYVARRRAEGVPADKHGTAYGYQLGCRFGCTASPTCVEVMTARDRDRARAKGRPPIPARVAADPVRKHVRSLLDSGMRLDAIAEQASVHRSLLGNLIYGRAGEKGRTAAPQLFVGAEKAERILAVRG